MSQRTIAWVTGLVLVGCGATSEDSPPAQGSGGASSTATTAVPTSTSTSTATSVSSDGGESSSSGGPPATPPPEIDCGTPTIAEGLLRAPYLQSVDGSSAHVVFATRLDAMAVVRIAPQADGPWTDYDAATTRFEAAYTQDTKDFWQHDAQIVGLRPNAAYCYEVLVDEEVVASGLSMFTAWDEPSRAVRVLAFGDSGDGSPQQFALRDHMLTRQFDVFLHLGDMAYGSGTFAEFEERVFGVYRDLMHRVPSYPVIGNHEYKTDGAQPYLDLYSLWDVALKDEDAERYYSFDYGDVHFIALDSNPEMLWPIVAFDDVEDDTMLDWLRADLAATDKPWRIAFFHHPPYSSGQHGSDQLARDTISQVLEEGEVDLVLAGHDHHYERSVPVTGVQATTSEAGGITYFVVGSGGAGLRDATGDWFTAAVNDEDHAYLDLVVEGCTARGEALAADGTVLDSFEVSGC